MDNPRSKIKVLDGWLMPQFRVYFKISRGMWQFKQSTRNNRTYDSSNGYLAIHFVNKMNVWLKVNKSPYRVKRGTLTEEMRWYLYPIANYTWREVLLVISMKRATVRSQPFKNIEEAKFKTFYNWMNLLRRNDSTQRILSVWRSVHSEAKDRLRLKIDMLNEEK